MKGAAERAGAAVGLEDAPAPFRAAARERRKGRGYPGGVVPDHISDSQCPARCILAFTYGRL